MKHQTVNQRILISLSIIVLLITINYFLEPKVKNTYQYFYMLVFFVSINVIKQLLIKFRVIEDDIEKIIEEKKKIVERNEKFRENNKAIVWLFLSFIGAFLSCTIPLLLFTTPERNPHSIWILQNDLVISSYWVFAILYYPYSIYVFMVGRKILKNEKDYKLAFNIASISTWIIFTTYLVFASDQPNLIFVMFLLCLIVTWLQLTLPKIFYHLHKTKL